MSMIVYIPLRGPEIREIYSEYYRFISDFSNLKNTKELRRLLDDEEGHASTNEIEFEIIYSSKFKDKENETIKTIAREYSFFKTDYYEEFLRIKISFVNNYEEDEDFTRVFLNYMIPKLSFILNLTYATKIDFLYGVAFSKDNVFWHKTELILSSLDYAYEHSIKVGWPKIFGLDLQQAISWYNLNDLNTEGNSQNKLHRAINAFSYQFSHLSEKNTATLFWTMLGIETLLADGNSNIISQIKLKSSIILGQPKEYKKKLDKLYNYRSRFVHGDIDFPAKFSSDFKNFELEYWDYLYFATSILIALIRTLIASNKTEFKFEYKLQQE